MQGTPSQTLRKNGYRLTPQRLMVLEALQAADGHVRAEEVCTTVRTVHPEVSESTIYRTLDLLLSLGLAMRTDLGGGEFSYHAAGKGGHHHLVCSSCGRIFEMAESVLDPLHAMLLQEYGFQADMRHFAIFGQCSDCRG